ncbi:dihydrofolate reductase family protein [Dactylosporangium sp. AC04546]|uniref:dihydrofolate reductase family protein n=1 Tax=Dactylosporangium sp. AC04546 TaxID=2862460 RepID=UPI001EE09D37|nr:dihydrofolate reductase family protein [Dactylosporangium sp. AC04546]WVK80143.1 dihydrofolate reductase family protein [Dactylosporangium sp. AC04546]
MGKLVVMAFMTLDGVVQGPGGADEDRQDGFGHGGWAVPHFDEPLLAHMERFVQRADGLVLGRRTYDIFAATWPLAADDDPIGARLNRMPKYVASRTLGHLEWENSRLIGDDVVNELTALKGTGELQVHGSGGFVQTLLRHRLVDELHLLTFPVVLGSGKRLFGGGTVPDRWRVADSTVTANGVSAVTYVRAGDVEYGAMGPETGNW